MAKSPGGVFRPSSCRLGEYILQDRIEKLAEQNRILLENLADMGSRLESSITILSALAEISTVILDAASLPQMGGRMAAILLKSIKDLEGVTVLFYDKSKNCLVRLAGMRQEDIWLEMIGPMVRTLEVPCHAGMGGRVFTSREAEFCVTRDCEKDGKGKGCCNQSGNMSCLPLLSGQRCLGVVCLGFAAGSEIGLHGRRLLTLLSGVMANIFHTFVLKQELDDKAESLGQKVEELGRESEKRKKAVARYKQSRRMLELVLDTIPQQVYWKDRDLVYLGCNTNFARYVGMDKPDDLVGGNDFLMPWEESDADRIIKSELEVVETGGTVMHQVEPLRMKDGRTLWLDVNRAPLRDDEGKAIGVLASFEDVTRRRRSEETRYLLAEALENTGEGILVVDSDGIIRMSNQSFCQLSGWGHNDLLGRPFGQLGFSTERNSGRRQDWSPLGIKSHWRGEVVGRKKDGSGYPAWVTVTAVRPKGSRARHLVINLLDITEMRRTEARIAHQAYHDALTDLPNRLLFNDRLNVAIAQAHRLGHSISIMFLDLDNFKDLNDGMGHAVGDMLLKAVAERLVTCVRDQDTVARLGGDEFIILVQGAHENDYAVHVANRVLAELSQPFHIEDQEVFVTASIGITLYPHDGMDVDTLVSNADMAMYQAKKRGRNTFKLFTPAMNVEVMRRVNLDYNMRKALEQEAFEIYYQPKVKLPTGDIGGFEALLRWRHPQMGMVSPSEFIPQAEETGLIVSLGKWVMECACRQARIWNLGNGLNIHVAVNISPRQFQQKNLVKMVAGILNSTGLAPELLELEVTENALINGYQNAVDTLVGLAGLGVRLAMDDFGTGYSSLAHLKRFPVGALKIDRSFVRGVPNDHQDSSIVRNIVALSQSLGLEVVAEGVETEAQFSFLNDLGCDQVQGFWFSPPQPIAQIQEMLTKGLMSAKIKALY